VTGAGGASGEELFGESLLVWPPIALLRKLDDMWKKEELDVPVFVLRYPSEVPNPDCSIWSSLACLLSCCKLHRSYVCKSS